MKLNNFYYSAILLDQLYNITLPDDQFEEIGLMAWNLIGNKRCRLYQLKATPNADGTVELPCNVDIIESVTYNFEDWDYTSNLHENGDTNTSFTEQYIEARKVFKDPLYIRGKMVKYSQVGNTLQFYKPYLPVTIVYKGEEVDENGLPEVTDKEARAIATYCAYVTKFKEGLSTNTAEIIQMADVLKNQWYLQADQARTPDYINQNDMERILEAKTSWNRKIHNKSFKVYN